VDLPLTGPEGPAARPALNGIRFFVQQHPRLDGFDVSITSADDAGGGMPNPQLGASNVAAFIEDPALVAMIGPFDSSVARKEVPVANAAALAMVSPSASSPCLPRTPSCRPPWTRPATRSRARRPGSRPHPR